MNIERKKVDPVDFSETTNTWQPAEIKEVIPPPMPDKKLHKPSTMTILKSKIAKWAIGLLATIPESYLYDLIKQIVENLRQRFIDGPRWLRLSIKVLQKIVAAIDPRSPGGRAITKEELKGIIDEVWV